MKKIFQTRTERYTGNCMQAAMASLFELELEQVPDFILEPNNRWHQRFWEFIESQGYSFEGTLYNIEDSKIRGIHKQIYLDHYNKYKDSNKQNQLERIKEMDGINGLFYASVYSPNYLDLTQDNVGTHAVLIDKNFNIVHDPNPLYQNIDKYPYADELGYNGIIDISMIDKK